MRFPKRLWTRALLALVVVFVLIQAVPYGRSHTNPPNRHEPAWDSPRTRELVRRACYDCHSNETTWPWYSHVAPFSWFLQDHVEEGREHLNFSETGPALGEADEAAEEVEDGEMPLWTYALAHAEARLSDAERAELAAGLRKTFPEHEGRSHGHGGDEDDD